MFLPRPLASSSAETAPGLKASAPSPYTVSVGSTTSSPSCTADTAATRPSSRCCVSAQSYRALIDYILLSRPRCRYETVPPGEILVVGGVPPADFLGENPEDRAALHVRVLDGDQAAGPEQPAGDPLHRPDGVESVPG